jgi:hypothetical protein
MTTHIIILYIACLGFAVLHYLSIQQDRLSINQDRLTVETIRDLETRINELEKGE